jgi:hypothetical protein
MVAYTFNPTQHNPSFGGGGDSLGVGKHPVIGSKVELKSAQSNNGNGYMALTVTAVDGPQKGGTKTIRLNLHNSSEVAQRIAEQQLAALCVVMGITGPWQDTDILLGKAFVIENVLQPGDNPKGYTDVTAVYTIDGRSVADAMANPPKVAGNAPAGFGGGQQQTTQQQQPPANGGGWQPAAGADTGATQQQQQQADPAPAGGGWGGGQTQAAPANNGGGWAQGSAAPSGGGWGQGA